MNALLVAAVFVAWPTLPDPTDWPQLPDPEPVQVAVAWPQLPQLASVKPKGTPAPTPQVKPQAVQQVIPQVVLQVTSQTGLPAPSYWSQSGTCVGGACPAPQTRTTRWRRRSR